MLRVTVELVPGGAEAFRQIIGSMIIGNVAGLAKVSDYVVNVKESANPLTGAGPQDIEFIVQGHDRQQSVWALIKRAITEMEAITRNRQPP